ncbi:phospho-acceptor domain-containing protein [Mucilaginibacter yixingensis]|uniref:histidine kinase n=1 Tax=Mucilaginibacter yixingensis TaxID=1295612 RepID=A0A2T5J503_9SPHI|nr:ATP-binding protein [Mucilaginibacter yixingensis]PTQ92909.1 phospho-acceptor domain-containing protein [Mucilaginibacter yixingensis]
MVYKFDKIPVLRYGLIVALIFILFSGALSLYLHYHRTQNLQQNISKIIAAGENSSLIDSCLFNMYSADNDSRLYALTGDKTYLKKFYREIGAVSSILERLKIRRLEDAGISADDLKNLVQIKASKTDDYVELRQLTDSLINTTAKIDSTLAYTKTKIPVPVVQTVKQTVSYDTVKTIQAAANPTVQQPRKGFLGRVFSVFSSKKNPQQSAIAADTPITAVVIKKDTVTQTTVKAKAIFTHIPKVARGYYRRLYNANNRLKRNEREIIIINNDLVTKMIAGLKQYKTTELAYARDSKVALAGNVTDVFKEYSTLSRFTLGSLVGLIVIVFYNIWKIFDNERQLLSYTEKTEQYATSKSKFMASMSHEIRTPLNSVIGFSEQLSMSELNPAQQEQVTAIRSSSRMLLDVVNEILDFSKYETGKMNFDNQSFMPYQALEEVFNSMVPSAAKKGILLKRNLMIDDDLCLVGDMLRFKQVVMNLMVNALKFTTIGEVFLQAVVKADGPNRVMVMIRVKDTGIGIAKHDLPLIFEEFSQVTDAQKVTHHKGTGLGLAICKKIVQLQGGKIKAISEVGRGSVFSFELPFHISMEGLVKPVQPMTDAELAEQVNGRHLLVVDDNQLNILLARTILKKWNITCDVAYNGHEAYELFVKNDYDLIATDIQMPVMDGLEFMALIRDYHNMMKADTPIIALTANVLKDDRDLYLRTGANDIVLKPFIERDLIEKIAGMLMQKQSHAGSELFRYG